jgi:thiamine-monophosphate kinase
MTTLGQLGERQIIDRLVERLGTHSNVVCGPGDDAAVVRIAADARVDLVLTSDAVLEGRHFTAGAHPGAVGRKAVARALSDLAAMGSNPQWVLIDIVAPATFDVAAIETVYEGATSIAEEHGVVIIGGDTAEGSPFGMHVFAVGTVSRDAAIYRSGASQGDMLFVTGSLGGSSLGSHLAFDPRIREGVWLGDWASSMIDLSDGLATDLRHIANKSDVGFVIKQQNIPISEHARTLDDKHSGFMHALRDGEDYELLFTVPEARVSAFKTAWAGSFDLECSQIGVATAKAKQIEIESPGGEITLLDDEGYEHFGPRE